MWQVSSKCKWGCDWTGGEQEDRSSPVIITCDQTHSLSFKYYILILITHLHRYLITWSRPWLEASVWTRLLCLHGPDPWPLTPVSTLWNWTVAHLALSAHQSSGLITADSLPMMQCSCHSAVFDWQAEGHVLRPWLFISLTADLLQDVLMHFNEPGSYSCL